MRVIEEYNDRLLVLANRCACGRLMRTKHKKSMNIQPRQIDEYSQASNTDGRSLRLGR